MSGHRLSESLCQQLQGMGAAGQWDGWSSVGGTGCAVAGHHLAVCQFQDAVVADGDPKDVRSQVLQGTQTARTASSLNSRV
jgi:hypothetical protein